MLILMRPDLADPAAWGCQMPGAAAPNPWSAAHCAERTVSRGHGRQHAGPWL